MFLIVEVHPIIAPILAMPDQDVFLPKPGMERMRDPEDLLHIGVRRSRRRSPTGSWKC